MYVPLENGPEPRGDADLVVTYFPGFGNCKGPPSDVVHPEVPLTSMLATNIVGNDDISLPSPPVMSAFTQFMYISLLPRVLNHVCLMLAYFFKVGRCCDLPKP